MKNKKMIVTILILLIITIMYNVLYFALPIDRTNSNISFWITYGFTIFTVIMIGVITWISFNRKELKSRIFGISIFNVIIFAGIIQFIFDALVMSLGHFYVFPLWITLVFELLFFSCVFISLISRTAYRNAIDSFEKKEEAKTSCIDELRIQSQLLVTLSESKAYCKKIEKMNDMFKYCDPVSDESVLELEDEILTNVSKLKELINSNNDIEVERIINIIYSQIEERSLRLKKAR